MKISWKNLKESARMPRESEREILFAVKKTGCACLAKTGVASLFPPLAESALAFCSSVSSWVSSVLAADASAVEVAVQQKARAEQLPTTCCRLLKTSTSMSPLTTAMILGRKKKDLKDDVIV